MTGEILKYQNRVGNISIDVRVGEKTVWLTQEMAILFIKAKSTINERFFYQKIKDIYTTSIDLLKHLHYSK
jgi:hypothetical protein